MMPVPGPRRFLPAFLVVAAATPIALAAAADAAGKGPADAKAAPKVGGDAPAIHCSIAGDARVAIAPAPGRKVLCAIDAGSKNVKLVVLSMEEGKPLTLRDERQCRRKLGLGARTFDSETKTARDLPAADIALLANTFREFQETCKLDGGTLLGAEATQWARDARNIDEVKAEVVQATGLTLDVLTPEQEGGYGYRAATLDRPGRVALDPGSNSFQLSFEPVGATRPSSVSVPLGYVRALKLVGNAPDYAAAQKAYRDEVRARIDEALAKLTPPASLAALRKQVAGKKLGSDLLVIGQDGAIQLAVRAALRDAGGKWLEDKKAFEARVDAEKGADDPEHGHVIATLSPAEIDRYLTAVVKPADYDALRSESIRDRYGDKALIVPVLVDFLIDELGLKRAVLVPQEMPTGYVLARLPAGAATASKK